MSGLIASIRTSFSKIPVARKAYYLVKDPVGYAIRYTSKRPRLKKWLLSLIRHLPTLENWLIKKKTDYLRTSCSRFLLDSNVSIIPAVTNADFSFNKNAQAGKYSVDEILDHIRAELRQS